ncbi:DUF1700 domain-containing protein [Undibacterium pigrum]|uniref:Putative membrane protein n=1 Tax=Undibacterium pigrum TaxID=401470 RepID=A0A318ITA5_9BURK|nr:DUF1700 domain-containing protein [Undibacterium pigrum]PXX38729.1 putative membrane protein [Undibacterium pigrum]
MNKTAYMNALRLALEGLPASVIEETMWTYERKFVDALVAGQSEEEIAASLPKPELVAVQKKASSKYQALKSDFSLGNIAGLLVALIGLMIFNVFMLIPAITYFSLLCSAYILALGMYVVGIGMTAASISGVEQFSFELPASKHQVHRHEERKRMKNHNVRVDVTETGILIDGEDMKESDETASTIAASRSVSASTATTPVTPISPATPATPATPPSPPVIQSAEHHSENLRIEVGNHFSGKKLFTGLGLLLSSIILMMLSMFITKYTFIGFKHYLRWNLSQLHLGHAV